VSAHWYGITVSCHLTRNFCVLSKYLLVETLFSPNEVPYN